MLRNWILAARPKTLSAAVVPVMIGTALAAREPPGMSWLAFTCALAGSILIQIATNFINDALDFRKGADTAQRLGPIRVTQAGLIGAGTVMRAAAACLILAAFCGLPLIYRGGWPMLAVGLASIAAAYAYTGGPFPLAYHGMGELFVMLFFGLVAVGGTFYVHSLYLTTSAIVAGLAAGALATVLLVINNLRDIDDDRRSEKRTLAVRFGRSFARAEIALFSLLPFVSIAVIASLQKQPWLLICLLALPLSLIVILRTRRVEGAELNRFLGVAGAAQWVYGVLFVFGSLA